MSFSSRESSSSGLKSSIESVQQETSKETPPLSAVPALVDGRSSGGSIPPARVGAKRSRPNGSERIQVPVGGGGVISCEVCGAGFPTIKGMFGHMKNHKNRGWKGAYPPPTFDYLSEFSEFQHLLVKPLDQQEEEEEEVAAAGGGATTEQPQAAEGRGRKSVTVPDLNNPAEAEEYLLPDLNLPSTGLL